MEGYRSGIPEPAEREGAVEPTPLSLQVEAGVLALGYIALVGNAAAAAWDWLAGPF